MPLPLTPLPRDEGYRPLIVSLQPQAAPIPAPPREIPAGILVALESEITMAEEVPSVPDVLALDEMEVPALDLDAMKDRYPLLRNAL